MNKTPFLLLSALALCGCGSTPSASNFTLSSADTSHALPSSSESKPESAIQSSEESTELSSTSISVTSSSSATTIESSEVSEESSESLSSESSSTHEAVPGDGAWELTAAALPANPATGKHYGISFSVTALNGSTVSFVGDAIRKGEGSKGEVSLENTIQLSKEEGNLYMTSGCASFVRFEIPIIHQYYGGVDHDFTGVPTVYSAEEMTADNGEIVELEKQLNTDETGYIYSFLVPHGRFRLANESGNALYIRYIANVG